MNVLFQTSLGAMDILIKIFNIASNVSAVDGIVGLGRGVLRLDKVDLIPRGLDLWGDNVGQFGIVHRGVLRDR